MFQLHPSLSFCEADGRHVFLDLEGDRYFFLHGDLAQAWRALLGGEASTSQLEAVKSRNLVVDSGGSSLAPCSAEIAQESLLDDPLHRTPWLGAIGHVLSVARTRRSLRQRGLAKATRRYIQLKGNVARKRVMKDELGTIAATFARLDLLVTTIDQCLPRSLALANHLARLGYWPELVFAVRPTPFRAHCWVECEGFLMNDRHDRVRLYQPIRRL